MWTNFKTALQRKFREEKQTTLAFTLLFTGSLVGLFASFVLSVEAITLAHNANAVLSCSINEALNCAAVGSHPSAALFGFPNAFVGMMAFPVLVTIAVAGLAGVKFPRWFMALAQVGALLGVVFAVWMFYMSYSVIQVLCPWCLTLDAAMVVVAFAMWRYTVWHNTFRMSKQAAGRLERFSAKSYDLLVVLLVVVAALAAVFLKFSETLFS